MLKDADGTIFIDADPFYFIWLCEKLCRLKHGWVDEIEMFDAVQPIPFYHDLFFAESPIAIDKPTEDSESQSAFRSFMAMMGAFIKSSMKGGRGGTEVLSVTVDGRTVATTDATLADFDTLNDRFTKYGRTPIVDVSGHHFDLVVDFARRCRLAPDGAVVPPPSCAHQDELVRVSEMYGVLEAMYPNILANDVMQTLLIMIGKKQPKMTCLFKSSLHGSSYTSLAQRVAGRRGLLFVIKCDDTNTIAVFADTKLQLPADPTSELLFWCAVSLFSVSGAFEDGITKIEVPEEAQDVEVAGTRGAVTDENGVPRAKVCIAGGRLWLGIGKDGPIDDLLKCYQWVWKKELPANRKFVGKTINSEAVSLCGAETYRSTFQRVEVFQVWSAVPADPILTADDLRALVDATGMTDAAPKLLYKGERDGWESEAMFKNVGDATDLLLLLKDLGGPVGDGITKIDLPVAEQPVWVAGTQGAVKNVECEPVGKVCIGDMIHKAPGRLWLGCQSADLRGCAQWLLKDRLPAYKKYIGTTDNKGRASLASSTDFMLADMEIYTLQPSAGWHWLSAVASLMKTSPST
ncbi:unnamed protein product [Vitrella brassicaformis CCMP3155]|uniref:TLDc domain-containing protein n=1 Tax=Vitrella brassicaformis (strain CCMP3155) TaxID=1169540 RepID=A0A0G4ECY7_VITBC|nr:unnamed protein product [Vitrella brassicaformis CCMP3155]|eukprot:CEL93422.1 unnamed protein product [Vitrella brassicaformis CCMP3155]